MRVARAMKMCDQPTKTTSIIHARIVTIVRKKKKQKKRKRNNLVPIAHLERSIELSCRRQATDTSYAGGLSSFCQFSSCSNLPMPCCRADSPEPHYHFLYARTYTVC